MQLIERRGLSFELRPTNLEDLWILSQFIAPQDRIGASTQRKVNVGKDKSKQVTKIIFVDLLVSKVQFESNVLRVSGEIQNETEFTAIGQSHTLTFQVGDTLKLNKTQLLKTEEKLLKKALESKEQHNLLVLLDKDDMIAVEFSDFFFTVLFSKNNLGSKKYYKEDMDEYEVKYKLLEELLSRDYSRVILAGPAHFKDELKKKIEEKISVKTLTLGFQEVQSSAVQRAIKEISSSGLVENSQLSEESSVISELLKNIDKGIKSVYSFEDTKKAIDNGSCEKLLVTTKLIEKLREEGNYDELNKMMITVEQLNGDLVIINSENDSGKVLDGLSGIAGILRY